MSFIKHIDKFCLDHKESKKAYEDLINDPNVQIINSKMVTGQGKDPLVFMIVDWYEYGELEKI